LIDKLLIGYGNPLRGDDGVGWLLASQLTPYQSGTTRIIAAHQLMPEMAEVVSQASEVLFVDAEVGPEPGRWSVIPARPEPGQTLSALGHHLTPGRLLALAQALYGAAPSGRVLAVAGADFGYGEGFSTPVEDVLLEVCEYIVAFLGSADDCAQPVPGDSPHSARA
jgi:hydrogenase maturation protease